MNSAMVGIDVGKRRLDVSVDQGKARRFANTTAGVAELVDWLGEWDRPLAICEATGGCELLVVATLRQAEIPVHIAHPNQVRDFARACGYQAKTDGLDAVVLSRMARCFNRRPRWPRTQTGAGYRSWWRDGISWWSSGPRRRTGWPRLAALGLRHRYSGTSSGWMRRLASWSVNTGNCCGRTWSFAGFLNSTAACPEWARRRRPP